MNLAVPVRPMRRGDCSERIDIRLVRDPIDFIAEEHFRQRGFCADLDRLAQSDTSDRELAAEILAHIRDEIPIHILDEEDDLFPLLRRRAEPEDDIETFISRLGSDHQESEARAVDVCDCLSRLVESGGKPDASERALLSAFASAERRHMIFENAIILPLARARLTAKDRRTLALRMAARRGFCLLPEVHND